MIFYFHFQQPKKPKLSTRLIVDSAKINLNRYWNKLEKMMSTTTLVKKNKKRLRKLKIINQQLLNNRILPIIHKSEIEPLTTVQDEIYGFTTEKFPPSKINRTDSMESVKSTYKPFIDDTLYENAIPTLMTQPQSALPINAHCVIDKTYDNYNFYLNACRQRMEAYQQNENAFYIRHLKESLRRKGYKFTLADIDRNSSDDNMYYKGQYLEDEGYLV
jgi:hypothetical protein